MLNAVAHAGGDSPIRIEIVPTELAGAGIYLLCSGESALSSKIVSTLGGMASVPVLYENGRYYVEQQDLSSLEWYCSDEGTLYSAEENAYLYATERNLLLTNNASLALCAEKGEEGSVSLKKSEFDTVSITNTGSAFTVSSTNHAQELQAFTYVEIQGTEPEETPPPAPENEYGITLSSETLDLLLGDSAQLVATVELEEAADKTVTFLSDKPEIVSVNSEGLCTGLAKGKTTITASCAGGLYSATCVISVHTATCSVTFLDIDSSVFHSEAVAWGAACEFPQPPQHSGYIFEGFSVTDLSRVVEDITVTTVWGLQSYTINYVLNGGTNPEGAPTTYTIESGAVALPTPVRAGYGFTGWFQDSGLTGVPVQLIESGETGNKTYYAGWKAAQFSITYILNGGQLSGAPTAYNTETQTFSLPIPTKNGYEFLGWFENAELQGTAVLKIEQGSVGNKVFYASWRAITYSITYVLSGGANPENAPASFTIDGGAVVLPTPARAGYSFMGWYDNEQLSGTAIAVIEAGSAGDRTLYAMWSVIAYRIVYVLNGGANPADAPTQYSVESADILLPTATRSGYSFVGWFDTALFSGTAVTQISKGSVGDKVFYASWSVMTYSITYALNGGQNPADAPVSFTVESPDIALPVPARTGYTFMGWYGNEQLTGNAATVVAAGTAGNVAYYAAWSPVQYSITYVLSGGTNPADAETAFNIESGDITLKTPTRRGYTFAGWFESALFSGNAVTVIPTGSVGNRTFYAAWRTVTYSITYHLNGGTNSLTPPLFYTVESPLILLPTPIKRGYSFCGWFGNAAFTGNAISAIESGSVGDKVFYARFDLIEYTITYNANGGIMPVGSPVGYNAQSSEIALPLPTKSGYTFAGWYNNASFSGNVITTIPTGSYGDITLYARWSLNTYTITYVLYGGQNPADAPTQFTVESADITLPLPARAGYTFTGWFGSSAYSGSPIRLIPHATTGNITLYCRWTCIVYTITYDPRGGTMPQDAPTSFTIESPTFTLPTPTKPGYSFAGWYSGESRVSQIVCGTIGNTALTARWELVTYTIAYALNGGTNPTDAPTQFTVESAEITLPLPARAGYTFTGWFGSSAYSGSPITVIPHATVGNITLYAKWAAIVYTIAYNTNGGLIPPNLPTSYTIETQTFNLPATSRPGYSFSGWYQNDTLFTQIVRGSMGNITLIARWQLNTYTISYVLNGGTNPADAATKFTVESANILLPVPARTGYDFVGWRTTASLTGQLISQIPTGSTGSRTYYAEWRIVTYTISYDLCGGSFEQESAVIRNYTIESDTFMLPIPVKRGYSFVGWYLNNELVITVRKGSFGNIDLVSSWTAIRYTITYFVYDGIMPADYATEFTIESEAVVLPRPTLVGHVFVGWYDNAALSGVPIREIDAGSVENRVFYAHWRKLIYTVSFYDIDGVTLVSKLSAQYGSSVIAPNAPAHYGYVFSHWNADLSFISQNLDVLPIYDYARFDVVFVDMDYSLIAAQSVEYLSAATAPEPPTHEGSVFVFWSADFSCVKGNMTVVAVYRVLTVPPKAEDARMGQVDEITEGMTYMFTVKTESGSEFALSTLERLEGKGLWSMEVTMLQNSIVAPVDEEARLEFAMFTASMASEGYSLKNSLDGEYLSTWDGFCLMSDEGGSFAYCYLGDAWRLYDIRNKTYLRYDEQQGYFLSCRELALASAFTLYERISITADYIPIEEPKLGRSYSLVATTSDNRCFALCIDVSGSISAEPVSCFDGKIFFNRSLDERAFALRFAVGDNKRGYYLRSVSSGGYLSADNGGLYLSTDAEACGKWVYSFFGSSNAHGLYDITSNTYITVSEDGMLYVTADANEACTLKLYERLPKAGKVGDANLDGLINTGDAVLLLRYAAGITAISDDRLTTCDATQDGRVNSGDAVIILRYVAGIVDWLA